MANRNATLDAKSPVAYAGSKAVIPDDELVYLYRQMLLARRFEERCAQSYTQAKIGGYCHLYIGQEANLAGLLSALRPNWDYVITAYRDHVQPIFMGTSPGAVMAELYGRKTGTSGGKGGSMHLYDPARGFMGGWGIVGGQIPIAIGFAFAAKYRNEDRVTLCFIGDGAVPIGAFHESLNIAGILRLPIVFVIENNQYAMGTALEVSNAIPDLYKHGERFNIQSRPVDGMDLWAVRGAMDEAVAAARNGEPQLIESKTYRFRGHSMADAGQYRTKEEVQEWKQRDPLETVGAYLLERGLLTTDDIDRLNEEIRAECAAAADFADNSPAPTEADLFNNVYV